MKIEQMDTTKEGCKAFLDLAAEKLNEPWHSQAAHKAAVGLWVMDCLNITEQADRDGFMAQWAATPSSFGTNASALGQALGRENGKAKTATKFAGF